MLFRSNNNDPANGKGFEAAVAYAVAKQLGYAPTDVKWTVAPFNSVIAPGDKTFDFDINQVSITYERKKAVDFSSGYYDVKQAIITIKGSKIANAKSIADLKGAKLGAQIGTTSYKVVTDLIKPTQQPAVFDTNDVAKQALANGQIDGLVLDLPTAFYITAAQIDRVRVGTNKNTPNALIHHKPTDNLQAKFSMEFCMATLLLYGKGGLTQFTDEVVNRPEVQEMIKRIDFGVDPIAEAAGYNKMTTILEIKLKDGRRITGRADFGRGSPEQPMSFDDVAAKFEDCAQFAKWPAAKSKQVIATVRKLEELTDIRRLTALLSA